MKFLALVTLTLSAIVSAQEYGKPKPGDVPPEIMANLQKTNGGGKPGGRSKGFKTNFGGKCEYRCPRGYDKPRAKEDHVPKFDGCGLAMPVDGVDLKSSKFDFRGCCNEHDRCYNTCNNAKNDCDGEFHSCMKMWCDYSYGNSRNKKKQDLLEECNKKADLLNTMTKLMQCESYMEAQDDGCECAEREEF